MDVEIICPLYNAEAYIEKLDKSLKKQKNVKFSKISYILTKSDDATQFLLDKISANYEVIEKKNFHIVYQEKKWR